MYQRRFDARRHRHHKVTHYVSLDDVIGHRESVHHRSDGTALERAQLQVHRVGVPGVVVGQVPPVAHRAVTAVEHHASHDDPVLKVYRFCCWNCMQVAVGPKT